MHYQIKSFIKAGQNELFDFCRSKKGFCSHFPFPVDWREGAEDSWKKGEIIDFRYRVYGIWLRHRAILSGCEPSRVFTDVQEKGVYQRFVHTHKFEEEAGGTWVIDEIEFTLGYGNLIDRFLGVPTI